MCICVCVHVCVYIHTYTHIHTTSLIHSSLDGHLGCSHVLASVNRVPMNICTYLFQIIVLSGYTASMGLKAHTAPGCFLMYRFLSWGLLAFGAGQFFVSFLWDTSHLQAPSISCQPWFCHHDNQTPPPTYPRPSVENHSRGVSWSKLSSSWSLPHDSQPQSLTITEKPTCIAQHDITLDNQL